MICFLHDRDGEKMGRLNNFEPAVALSTTQARTTPHTAPWRYVGQVYVAARRP